MSEVPLLDQEAGTREMPDHQVFHTFLSIQVMV